MGVGIVLREGLFRVRASQRERERERDDAGVWSPRER